MIDILIYFGLGIVGLMVLLLLLSTFIRFQQIRKQFSQKYSVVQVRVPKENESGPKVTEQIYATLHSIQSNFSFWKRLCGVTSKHVSFEIASIDGVIKFYVAFPSHLRNLVEGQMYAQYPDVEIQNADDYSMKAKNFKNAVGVNLKFIDTDVFPIKRYVQFEDKLARVAVDPMAGLTSSLVKFNNKEDQAWVQMVVTPMPDRWRIIFTRCVRILNKGVFGNIPSLSTYYADAFTTRKAWPKIVFFPLYFVFWLQGLMANAGLEMKSTEAGSVIVDSDEFGDVSSSTHERETSIDAAMDKVVRPLFAVNIRVVYVPKEKDDKAAETKLREVVGAFKQFNFPSLNGFDIGEFKNASAVVADYRKRMIIDGLVMNNEELATIYHMPNHTVKTPTIFWVSSKKLEPPSDLPGEFTEEGDATTVLGKSNFRGHEATFGIKPDDRRRHIYIIGKTGMGKSTVLENMIYSDIMSGKGVGVIDPHGDLADAVLSFVPANRTNDVVLIDPSDRDFAVAFNMLENVDSALNSIVCSGLVGIFKKIYAESWGPRLEHILRNTILLQSFWWAI